MYSAACPSTVAVCIMPRKQLLSDLYKISICLYWYLFVKPKGQKSSRLQPSVLLLSTALLCCFHLSRKIHYFISKTSVQKDTINQRLLDHCISPTISLILCVASSLPVWFSWYLSPLPDASCFLFFVSQEWDIIKLERTIKQKEGKN